MGQSEELTFSAPVTSDKDLQKIYNYNVEVFAETDDFDWTIEGLKQEIKDGWKLYSVSFGDQIIAAVFMKQAPGVLLTKATPIKIEFQGHGFSHKIKEHLEKLAKKQKLKKIFNYCRRDNFRMISLNETHGYERTGKIMTEDKNIIEWEKNLK